MKSSNVNRNLLFGLAGLLSVSVVAVSSSFVTAKVISSGQEPIVVVEPTVVHIVENDTETPNSTEAPAPQEIQVPEKTPQEILQSACAEFSVDYGLMYALVEKETRWQNLVGDNGASIGYCQIQPKWWSGLMEEIGAEDLHDPEDNLRTGCAIMQQLLYRYDGDVMDALTAYNSGSPGNSAYAQDIMDNMC